MKSIRRSFRRALLVAMLLAGVARPLRATQCAIIKADDFTLQTDAPSNAVSAPYLQFIKPYDYSRRVKDAAPVTSTAK